MATSRSPVEGRRAVEQRKTVLMVDDEPDILNAVADALLDEGYQVFKARNGADAQAHAVMRPPDAVVSNVRMPELDGIQLAAALRGRGLEIPIVLMSATNEEPGSPGMGVRLEAVRAGSPVERGRTRPRTHLTTPHNPQPQPAPSDDMHPAPLPADPPQNPSE